MGNPGVEELYQISTTKSRETVFKMGKVEGKKFEDVFTGATPEGKFHINFVNLIFSYRFITKVIKIRSK